MISKQRFLETCHASENAGATKISVIFFTYAASGGASGESSDEEIEVEVHVGEIFDFCTSKHKSEKLARQQRRLGQISVAAAKSAKFLLYLRGYTQVVPEVET